MLNYDMFRIALFVCAMNVASCMASDILHSYFQSVECDNSILIVKFKPSGQRYGIEKSKNSLKSAYNQSIEIFAGDKVVFRGKNSSLTVESVLYDKSTEEQRSFLSKNNISPSYICNVHSFHDMRSIGRGIEKNLSFCVNQRSQQVVK